MYNLRDVFGKLSRRPSVILSSLEEALKDSSIDNATFSLNKINLTSRLKVEDMRARGGSADVHMGQLKIKGAKTRPVKVAVKVFRLYVPGAEKVSTVKTPLFLSVHFKAYDIQRCTRL